MRLIEKVNVKYGNTIIMVTHNEAIKNMADHVIKLHDGNIRRNEINATDPALSFYAGDCDTDCSMRWKYSWIFGVQERSGIHVL